MAFEVVLLDIDNTLFDFHESSFEALVRTFSAHGAAFDRADFARYSSINDELWEAFERGAVEKEAIFDQRFRRYFQERGLRLDPVAFNVQYLHELGFGTHLMPHAKELLQALYGRYKIYIVTNGDTATQQSRIALSGLGCYFDDVFISEQMGCKKPDAIYFDKVFAEIGEQYRKGSLLVGDSLSSDMQGGRNAGVATCFYGPPEKADARCDYVVTDLMQVLDILARS